MWNSIWQKCFVMCPSCFLFFMPIIGGKHLCTITWLPLVRVNKTRSGPFLISDVTAETLHMSQSSCSKKLARTAAKRGIVHFTEAINESLVIHLGCSAQPQTSSLRGLQPTPRRPTVRNGQMRRALSGDLCSGPSSYGNPIVSFF